LTRQRKQKILRVDPIRIDLQPTRVSQTRKQVTKSKSTTAEKPLKEKPNLTKKTSTSQKKARITKKKEKINLKPARKREKTKTNKKELIQPSKITTKPKYTNIFTGKVGIFITTVLIIISFIGGISAVGLLQSSENIVTSGIIVQPSPPPSPVPPPPEPKIDIAVYSDPECTQETSRIEWGTIEIGNSIKRSVYIKNQGETPVLLNFITENWEPSDLSEHIELVWDYEGISLEAGASTGITLTLTVKTSIRNIGGFNFDIVFVGSAN